MSFDKNDLGRLFETADDAVLGIEDGLIRFLNPAAVRLLGAAEGTPASDVLPEEVLSNPSERFTAACVLRDAPVDLSAVRSGGVTLIRAVPRTPSPLPRPVSDRVLAEFGSDLAAAQRAVEEFSRYTEQAGILTDQAAMLCRSFFRLRRLHRHLSLAESIRNGQLPCRMRPAELGALCADLCDSVEKLAGPYGARLRFEKPDAPCYALLDEELIETMLLIVLTNSLQYTAPGDEIEMTLTVKGDRCIVAVNDPGSGMTGEKLAGALAGRSPAEMTDVKAGAGLGLYIARSIAEAHGGAVLLESREDKGTCIRFSLPRLAPEGLEILSRTDAFRHPEGLRPILTELSVWLDRGAFRENLMD